MPRDYGLYLDDIAEAIKKVLKYTRDLDFDEFEQDERTVDAVIRNLEIIGEAAGHLPEELRARAPGIEWRKVVALRNVLSHAYFSVSLPLVWDVVQNKLVPLSNACEKLIQTVDKEKTP